MNERILQKKKFASKACSNVTKDGSVGLRTEYKCSTANATAFAVTPTYQMDLWPLSIVQVTKLYSH